MFCTVFHHFPKKNSAGNNSSLISRLAIKIPVRKKKYINKFWLSYIIQKASKKYVKVM